jgi:NADPH-dependent glutamate synthase beta subunit-like oxidoreductase/NAD(P)H-flavin reductase
LSQIRSHDRASSGPTPPFIDSAADNLPLGFGDFTYADLYQSERLRALAEAFCQELERADAELAREFTRYREAGGAGFSEREESELLVRAAPHLGGFLARLFGVERERAALIAIARDEAVISEFKKMFIQRRVRKLDAAAVSEAAREFTRLEAEVAGLKRRALGREASGADEELVTARLWRALSEDQEALNLLERWAAVLPVVAPERSAHWVSYRQPHALDYDRLVQIERPRADLPELMIGPDASLRRRDGFKLTDPRMSARETLDEAHYCIYCHERDKDSCSKGFHEKDGAYRTNPLGIELTGCPLDEKISEAHLLRKDGDALAALAVVMIDNPMCPGTGHRICNDCMKACIFQKQDPVNIPQIETGLLTDVLQMPYGVEIYGLLTRWNPLNVKRPYALPYNGKNVLVVGLGPAGYTLAHYLLNEGFGVVGIDGLKIEPLPEELIGASNRLPRPVREWRELYQELDRRILEGFGGVSEYGITVRWDKNFLTLLHLVLARRDHLRIYGGVRFGGTLTIEDAWELGFDHIAIATGAGKPTIIGMKNNLIRGIRKASDFLMALQLTGAFKDAAMANLQAQLPAVVIGGGLTAIDTATELAAYYPVQVEKMLARYEKLVAAYGAERFWKMYDEEERAIMERFLVHGRAARAERERAAAAGELPNFIPLVRQWGGVSIVYRKTLQDSPAYRLNHEEVIKSLEEGISFIECLNPLEAIPDEFGAVGAIQFERQRQDEKGKWRATGELVTLPARSVCVAAGTSPNIIYEKEQPGTFKLDRWNQFFQGYKLAQNGTRRLEPVADDGREVGFFTSYEQAGRYITYYGDNHPVFAGNVVKAMASAKLGYQEIVRLFAAELARLDPARQAEREAQFSRLIATLDDNLIARVMRVDRLTPTIVEVIVRAPYAARKFHPGQFYRLQNYEATAPEIAGTRLMMEGLALTGAWTDAEQGLLSLIVLEMGGSSRLCAALRPGEPVVVMGPTGAPTEIPAGETVLLAGGGLGNAVLFSIARALKERGNRVIYFAGYKKRQDIFKREEIEAATDQVIWSVDYGEMIEPHRPQDHCFTGNIVQAMKAYADGIFGPPLFQFCEVDRIIAIGSDRMMGAVKVARKTGALASYFKPDHLAIGSINSPMQCMMKEVCAQCLQKHVDPETGAESGVVFSCFNQDQKLDEVDFKNLNDRLRANTVQEKLSNLWLDHLLEQEPIAMI